MPIISTSQAKATTALRLSAATRRLLAELPPVNDAANTNAAGNAVCRTTAEVQEPRRIPLSQKIGKHVQTRPHNGGYLMVDGRMIG